MAEMIRDVVIHEVGHYFGLDDETMEEMGTKPEPACLPTLFRGHCPLLTSAFPNSRLRCSGDQILPIGQKFFFTPVSFVPMVSAYAENDNK